MFSLLFGIKQLLILTLKMYELTSSDEFNFYENLIWEKSL